MVLAAPAVQRVTSAEFFGLLRWLDGRPLCAVIEPYRQRLFEQALDTVDADGRQQVNLVLTGRAKKNWKSTDAVLACFYALLGNDSPGGNQVYLVANDEGQANDDLQLAKKLVAASPFFRQRLLVKQKMLERRDGRGFLQILPAQFAVGEHGKTFRLLAVDEIHGQRDWSLLEALQLDPHRPDAQIWITSYASVYHRPGVPLFDLMQQGRAGGDPRMLFSWYAADFTTDPDFADLLPELRANPSRGSWPDPDGYLAQQQARLPAHVFRRLHLNLPGLPAGSALQPEPVMDSIARGTTSFPPEPGRRAVAFVDMSGGSNDDACLAIGWEADGRYVVARVLNQGSPPPFDPRLAVARFADVLQEYGCSSVVGDKYAGETFKAAFADHGIAYVIAEKAASQLYEAFEVPLNARRVVLPDVPILEQQFLGLAWRGGKIDHLAGEHDDYSNAVAGCVAVLQKPARVPLAWCV